MRTLVRMQPKMDSWLSLNGVIKMDVHGMRILVRWLPQMGFWMLSNGVVKMDAHGIVELVKMLLKMGVCEVLKWCRQNGCPWDKSTCEALESEGHDDDVLRWSFENGCICEVCSKYGNLD
jgi:hypothetical protein